MAIASTGLMRCAAGVFRQSAQMGFVGIEARGVRQLRTCTFALASGGSGPGNGGNYRGASGFGGDGGSSEGGRGGWWRAASFGLAAWQLATAGSALAAAKKEEPAPVKSDAGALESLTDTLVAMAGPIVANLGFSGMLGYAAAYALKTVGKMLAVFVGMIFLLLQGMQYMGYISMNWAKIHTDVIKTLDQNNDGKLDAQDLKIASNNLLPILAQGVPSVTGFAAGFYLGIK